MVYDITILKSIATLSCLIGLSWFVSGQSGFMLGFFLFFAGIDLFIICIIFQIKSSRIEGTVKIKEQK